MARGKKEKKKGISVEEGLIRDEKTGPVKM